MSTVYENVPIKTKQLTYFILSHVNIDIVPPPLKTTVTNTITNTVVSIISRGNEEVLRIANANATAPRKPKMLHNALFQYNVT